MFAFTYFAELPWYTCMASRIATQVSLTLYYLLFPSHNPHPPAHALPLAPPVWLAGREAARCKSDVLANPTPISTNPLADPAAGMPVLSSDTFLCADLSVMWAPGGDLLCLGLLCYHHPQPHPAIHPRQLLPRLAPRCRCAAAPGPQCPCLRRGCPPNQTPRRPRCTLLLLLPRMLALPRCFSERDCTTGHTPITACHLASASQRARRPRALEPWPAMRARRCPHPGPAKRAMERCA